MWWKKKTKERDLQSELEQLQEKYKDVINSYCMVGERIFIFMGFVIKDNEVQIKFYDQDTPKTMVSFRKVLLWCMMYGHSDFNVYRANYLRFKERLKHIGLEIQKVEFKY